jgi:aerobic C4-dicarboxylate transport protein
MSFLRTLYGQVIVGILLGSLLGWMLQAGPIAINLGVWQGSLGASDLKPFADLFIKAIKMLIAPIIFCTVVGGIASMSDLKKLGRVGGKSLLYFEVITTLALVIGLLVARAFQPGAGIHATAATLDTKDISGFVVASEKQSTLEFFTKIIPDTFFGAFTGGEILQVLFIAILSGVALAQLGSRASLLVDALNQASLLFFKLVGMVSKAAPIAAFAAMAFTIGRYGIGTLASLGKLMACVYLTCGLFVAIVLGLVCRLHGLRLMKVLRSIKEELLMTLGTSSSEVALPSLMTKLEAMGCPKSIVGIVLPAGYSFNLDGTSIYLTMAALFIAQATDTPLSLGQELGLLGVLMLTSKGAAAVTGGGFITLAATLSATGVLPVAGLALIFGIDRFMSEARALTNLVGNTVAVLVVSKWEGAKVRDVAS